MTDLRFEPEDVGRPGNFYGHWGEPSARSRGAPPWAGRYPRGYRRPDERIYEDICDRMTAHGYLDASDIEVQVEDGVATLTGTTPDRGAKYLAEDIAESVAGVREVRNELRIGRPAHPGGQQSRETDRRRM